jgi:transposase-like protein
VHISAIRRCFRLGYQPDAIASAFDCDVNTIRQLCIGIPAASTIVEVPPHFLPSSEPKPRPGKPLAIPERRAIELCALVNSGATTAEMMRIFGVSEATLSKAVKRYGIHRTRCHVTNTEQLHELITSGQTYDEIATELGVTKTSVASAIKRFNLPKPKPPTRVPKTETVDIQRLATLVGERRTDREIAAEFGVNTDKIRAWRKQYALPKTARPMPDADIVALYIERGETYNQLAERFAVSKSTIRNIVTRSQLPSPRLIIPQPDRQPKRQATPANP